MSDTPETASEASSESTAETQETAAPTTPIQTVGDDVTKTAQVTAVETPAADATVTETPVAETVAAAPASTSTTVAPSDNDLVVSLKSQLAAFVAENQRDGLIESDFTESAKKINAVTKFVIKYPKVPVLQALLDFFRENVDGVCSDRQYLLGSTTLPFADQAPVGYLYALWSDLANKRLIRVDQSKVIAVLKKPEIFIFYNRVQNAIRQQAAK